MAADLQLKRVYEPPAPEDGRRVLVDRLWPRGLRKDAAHIDVWLKEIAPSTALRRWFGHQPDRWEGFRERYAQELKGQPAVEQLRQIMAAGPVTLLFAAKDIEHNDAVVLAEHLDRRRTSV
jgi:uncharacterized protein YeaO (DUF488 family)